MHPFVRAAARLAGPVVDFALPPRCPACGAIVAGDRRFCLACWSNLTFIGPPWCAACNLPFAFDRGEGTVCARCMADPPPHDGVRAALAYGDVARAALMKLKYGRRIGLARMFAEHLIRHMPDEIEGWTLVPVPLHRWRIWSRGFNQAMLIAGHLASLSGVPVADDWVMRIRSTKPLKGAGRAARAKMMRGAFAVPDAAREAVAGARILLVDDVFTSGATTGAIARVLKRAGASDVRVMAWARVIDETADRA